MANLVRATDISKSFFGKIIFKNSSFTIKEATKYALIGRNGAGKSTLFKMIEGSLQADEGELFINPIAKISSLNQMGFNMFDMSVRDIISYISKDMTALLKKSEELQKKIEEEYDEKIYLDYLDSLELFNNLGGYDYFKERDIFINTFGLDKYLDRKFLELSGGQMQYIRLLTALFSSSNLVLLDEPLNFLDRDKVDWLRRYIKESNKSYIIISHDEDFLKNIVDGYLIIKDARIKEFMGSYDNFKDSLDSLYDKEEAENRFINNEIKRLDDAIRETIRKRDRAPEPHVHVVLLERLRRERRELIAKLNKFEEERVYDFKSKEIAVSPLGVRTIKLQNIDFNYGGEKIFSNLNLSLTEHSHSLIIGDNGTGKTTLTRLIVGELSPQRGQVHLDNIKIKSLDQVIMPIDKDISLKDYVRDIIKLGEANAKILRKNFYFDDIWDNSIKTLSGGELRRLSIASSLLDNKDEYLILDEPTTFLDVDVKKSLLELINAYGGGLLVISHDGELVDNFRGNIYELTKRDAASNLVRLQ